MLPKRDKKPTPDFVRNLSVERGIRDAVKRVLTMRAWNAPSPGKDDFHVVPDQSR
jgi:hypothetical protein